MYSLARAKKTVQREVSASQARAFIYIYIYSLARAKETLQREVSVSQARAYAFLNAR